MTGKGIGQLEVSYRSEENLVPSVPPARAPDLDSSYLACFARSDPELALRLC
jgi:hypothetical protein